MQHLKLDSNINIPLCGIEPIICTNWFCNAKGFKTSQPLSTAIDYGWCDFLPPTNLSSAYNLATENQ
jgi:hypothetical protein